MELGALIYILLVFGFGGLLLLVSIIYLLRELFRESRPTWRARSTSSKIVLIGAFVLAVLLASVPAQMLWLTRPDAIAGNYCADGSWGSATLVILEDGNFVETWHFKNDYSGKPEGSGQARGHWRSLGRDGLTTEMEFSGFRKLAEYSRAEDLVSITAGVEAYSGTTAIDVDSGADIYFTKCQ